MNQKFTTFNEEVRKLLIKHDPLFACSNPSQQGDEYDLELPKVVAELEKCTDYKNLRSKLRAVFKDTVGVFEAGTIFRYSALAKDLMTLKNGFGKAPISSPSPVPPRRPS